MLPQYPYHRVYVQIPSQLYFSNRLLSIILNFKFDKKSCQVKNDFNFGKNYRKRLLISAYFLYAYNPYTSEVYA